ncbi:MAG: N-acetyl-gamma-glutamyl-phosphate reductase [Pseudomonadota bacterium]
MTKRVFIDGAAGTTGLEVWDRLAVRPDIELLEVDQDRRKDTQARRACLNEADLVVLCLPDAAAREAVELISNPAVKVIDASTAHRTAPGWVYGFPEMTPDHHKIVAESNRVSNPGCYPTGFIALVRPLVSCGLLPAETRMSVHAVSGYSGGGRPLIETFESGLGEPFSLYGLGLQHKHLPEMQMHGLLAHPPLFCPSIADYRQGMLVSVPLHMAWLRDGASATDLQDALEAHFFGQACITVHPLNDQSAFQRDAFLRPDGLNGTNHLEIFVFANQAQGQILLVARLDNLGKGASGQSVQCLELMLGLGKN